MALSRMFRRTVAWLAIPLAVGMTAALRPAVGAAGHGSERIAATEDAWLGRADVPGVVVAVQQASRPAWLRASGSTARSGGAPLGAAARFRVASITKTFVAVVVLQLVQERRLTLDEHASAYVPVAADWEGVTIRQLLNHTSGIPDYSAVDEDFGPALLTHRNRRWTPGELVSLAHTATPLFEPGTDYSYSNTDYLVLGEIISAVTGRSWAVEVRRRILDKLDLNATYVAGLESGPPVTLGYFDADNDGDEENIETGREWPSLATSEGAAGAIVSTAADLSTFATALFHGRLLDAASLKAMTAEGPFHPRGSNYGLGLEISRPDYTTTVWGHGGFLPGFRSTLWYVPSADLTIVVLANDSRANTPDLAELVLRVTRS